MPGQVQPTSGLQGFWAQIQALTQRITSLEVWQRTQRAPVVGVATVTWPGATPFSNVNTTPHGLGRTPRAYAVFANGTTSVTNQNFHCAGTNAVAGQSVSVDATNLYFRGWSLQANPNAGETGNVLWLAIG